MPRRMALQHPRRLEDIARFGHRRNRYETGILVTQQIFEACASIQRMTDSPSVVFVGTWHSPNVGANYEWHVAHGRVPI